MNTTDKTAWICPNSPFGHDWNGGLHCRLCGTARTAQEALESLLASQPGWDDTRAAALVELHALEARSTPNPLIVSRFDIGMEPALEEEQVFTIGAIAEDGTPVALMFDEETRRKVGGWLVADAAEVEQLRARVAEMEAAAACTEFAVRLTADALDVRWHSTNREFVEEQLAYLRGSYPDARLVQFDTRHGAWTDVPAP